MVSNQFDDTGKWLKAVADFEHDDPEQAPAYLNERLVNLGGIVLVTKETAEAIELEAA